jgi:hypothetical protein
MTGGEVGDDVSQCVIRAQEKRHKDLPQHPPIPHKKEAGSNNAADQVEDGHRCRQQVENVGGPLGFGF